MVGMQGMLIPFRLGLGGSIGPGTQFMSWIHLRDLARAVIHFLEDDHIGGPVNMCAPEPVTMDVFTQIWLKQCIVSTYLLFQALP